MPSFNRLTGLSDMLFFMRKVLVIQHIDCEPLGSFLLAGEPVTGAGKRQKSSTRAMFEYVRPYKGDNVPESLDSWDALIILGGPMAVYDADSIPRLKEELALIGKALAADVPTLGICLGAQLIAAAAGARVYAGPLKEIGWSTVALTKAAASDKLFSALPATLTVFQLHGDTFDLPNGAVRLAANDLYANQAFRLGNNIYGLQFHVEVTGGMVKEWSGYYSDHISEARISPDSLLEDLPQRSESLRRVASRIITRFLQLI